MPELHSLQFVWPRLLWLLLAWPSLAFVYVLWRRAQDRRPNVWRGADVGPGGRLPRWRASLPLACVALGLALLLLAVARPRAMVLLPGWSDRVMLVMDSSGSMRADDVKPSRIEAAQSAAHALIDALPMQVRLGVVSAAGAAALVQAPTDDREALRQAIDGLSLQRGSALGSGILIALSALLPGSGIDVQALLNDDARPKAATGAPLPGASVARPQSGAVSAPQAPGSNKATAIILVSDGQSNFGPDLQRMAELAASHGVRVFTVGVGTPQGVVLKANGVSMRVRLDEVALEKVASITQGVYFRATSADELLRIYGSLSRTMSLQKHQLTEITGLVGLLGLCFISLGASLAFWRHGRVI